jgi:hypothetical protein
MRGLRVRNSISNEKRAVVTWPNGLRVGQVFPHDKRARSL